MSAKEFEEITLYAFCYNKAYKQIKHEKKKVMEKEKILDDFSKISIRK